MSKVPYLAPNFITVGAMACGLGAMLLAHRGDFVAAAWLLLFSTFLDRADGFVARRLQATSSFGVQMDSFADFFNFGVVPPFMILTALSSTPGLPFGTGSGLAWALLAAGLWLAAAAVRLARFNVLSDAGTTDKTIFHGVPTTLAAGLLVNWFLVCLKYGGPDNPLAAPDRFAEGRLFGDLLLGPGVWAAFPWAMIAGALLMVSNLRNKKFGALSARWANLAVAALSLVAFAFMVMRVYPEFMVLLPSTWLAIWLVWGQIGPGYRGQPKPPLFPVGDE
ncbi:CDP-alcohol phosphatidyltransferase family protein [Nannocystis bainbridge]|uniref:CDP-alcohol phosphatidyltransferase family protein n=1 Tax=Nannocystis bainbridge TaxID=2995303 RepID=A0ABT5E6V4_9BACT|nr:CDP-alcohol phosphatidyltransferase family protein [Nannocystis bainbridge]MDC0720542.1 CDP-alcohol phosphatidyltransferase family protein [Nannocystis bainbridge]